MTSDEKTTNEVAYTLTERAMNSSYCATSYIAAKDEEYDADIHVRVYESRTLVVGENHDLLKL